MRIVESIKIKEAVRNLFLEACGMPSGDALRAIKEAYESESCPPAKEALRQLVENARIARYTGMPYCQDTGMAVVFIDIGQGVHVEGDINAAVNEGVREAYAQGYFRKSVRDPLTGVNTGDNTPAIIHYDITAGESIDITVAPKGFGSENASRLAMLKPSDGNEGVRRFVIECVKNAGAGPCPPVILGIGIGGNFESCALLAKKQLLREIGSANPDPVISGLERSLKDEINGLGIGAMGFGGENYCLAVHIAKSPTHIAGLPVAVNFQCHASRHKSMSV